MSSPNLISNIFTLFLGVLYAMLNILSGVKAAVDGGPPAGGLQRPCQKQEELRAGKSLKVNRITINFK